MATYSSTLAWKIPQLEEPGRLQSMELQRVRPQQSVCARTHTHVCMWLTHFAVQQKVPQPCEATISQLKEGNIAYTKVKSRQEQ